MKGFTLPTSNTTTNGSFSNLITQTSANANTIVQAPLVNPGNYLRYAGDTGFYWSSASNSSSGAYPLYIEPYYVYPSTDARPREYGFPLRCVALGGWT